ncbi:MAG: hypothetical protein ABSH39_19555 [Candidatus Acidiferrum sp.]|jgi:hypothetical protein
MDNCEIIQFVDSSNVEERSFDQVLHATKLAQAIRNRATGFRIARTLRNLDKDISKFLGEIHGRIQGTIVDPPAKGGKREDVDVSPVRVRAIADNLEHTARTIEYLYEMARRARLTNNSMTAGPLNSLHHQAPQLIDLADWIETVIEKKEVESVFERAERERAAGEIYDLSQL